MQIDFADLWEQHQGLVIGYGLKVIGAVLLLFIGLRVASVISNQVRIQASKRDNIDATLASFFSSIVQWALVAAVVIACLQVFGVQATSFVAILGALTLAIGLSMQGALGNIASGVMIMIFRPFKLGDFVQTAGSTGTVKDINLFQTVLSTPDGVKIIVPNGEAINGVITNFSGYEKRRCDITFGIDYTDDMDKAISLISEVINADPRVLRDPAEPFIKVTNLGDSSVDISTRTWCKASDLWDMKFDFIKKVKESFDANGISIPYPHTTIDQKAPWKSAAN